MREAISAAGQVKCKLPILLSPGMRERRGRGEGRQKGGSTTIHLGRLVKLARRRRRKRRFDLVHWWWGGGGESKEMEYLRDEQNGRWKPSLSHRVARPGRKGKGWKCVTTELPTG